MQENNTHVIVGMSGGVDSSVTAHLLKQAGYHVEGMFMKNWDEDDGTEYCTALSDLADAEQVAQKLNIPLHRVNFAAEYWDEVFANFLEEVNAGRTPNPDILCNREIKFRAFLDYAKELGADFIATGHYARRIDGPNPLCRGLDRNKDQSYFLWALTAEQVTSTLFPVGDLKKPEVRKIAVTGEIIGQHQGLMFYTLGQRQGLGIGGLRKYPDEPWFVCEKRLAKNELVVVQGTNHPSLFSRGLSARQINWIGRPPELPNRLTAKVRYRTNDAPCSIEMDGAFLRILFDYPQRAITPGQSVVVYDGEVCLGGAVIEEAFE